MKTKYPNIKVKLIGTDGDAFAILGKVRAALKKGGVPQDQIDSFLKQAMFGDYDKLLRTCAAWVDVA